MLRPPRPGDAHELAGHRPRPPAPPAAAPPRPAAAREKAEAPADPPGPGARADGGPRAAPKEERQQLRRRINSRERRRMRDLSLAMDALREVLLPRSAAHGQGAPGRKLSKMATLLLARSHILLLGGALRGLRRALGPPRPLPAGLPLPAPAEPPCGPGLCPCAACQFPAPVPAGLGLAAVHARLPK